MANRTSKNLVFPRSIIKEKEGIVILPLKKWREIEEELEDLEMLRSETLAKEISIRRKGKKTVPLEKLLKNSETFSLPMGYPKNLPKNSL